MLLRILFQENSRKLCKEVISPYCRFLVRKRDFKTQNWTLSVFFAVCTLESLLSHYCEVLIHYCLVTCFDFAPVLVGNVISIITIFSLLSISVVGHVSETFLVYFADCGWIYHLGQLVLVVCCSKNSAVAFSWVAFLQYCCFWFIFNF